MKKDCPYYPCHKQIEICEFCYCPLYPCKNTSRGGYWKKVKTGRLWACEKCVYPHLLKNVNTLRKIK